MQQGVAAVAIRLKHFSELRYALQINQVAVPAKDGIYDAASGDRRVATLERGYERLYGTGSGFHCGVAFERLTHHRAFMRA